MKYGSTGHFTLPAFSLSREDGSLESTRLHAETRGPSHSHPPVALAGQSVTLQAWGQRDVADDGPAAAALQTHLGGLRLDARGRDDDAVHLHQTGHLLRLHTRKNRRASYEEK